MYVVFQVYLICFKVWIVALSNYWSYWKWHSLENHDIFCWDKTFYNFTYDNLTQQLSATFFSLIQRKPKFQNFILVLFEVARQCHSFSVQNPGDNGNIYKMQSIMLNFKCYFLIWMERAMKHLLAITLKLQ